MYSILWWTTWQGFGLTTKEDTWSRGKRPATLIVSNPLMKRAIFTPPKLPRQNFRIISSYCMRNLFAIVASSLDETEMRVAELHNFNYHRLPMLAAALPIAIAAIACSATAKPMWT